MYVSILLCTIYQRARECIAILSTDTLSNHHSSQHTQLFVTFAKQNVCLVSNPVGCNCMITMVTISIVDSFHVPIPKYTMKVVAILMVYCMAVVHFMYNEFNKSLLIRSNACLAMFTSLVDMCRPWILAINPLHPLNNRNDVWGKAVFWDHIKKTLYQKMILFNIFWIFFISVLLWKILNFVKLLSWTHIN